MTLPSVFTSKPHKHLCVKISRGKIKFTLRYLYFAVKTKKKKDTEVIHM